MSTRDSGDVRLDLIRSGHRRKAIQNGFPSHDRCDGVIALIRTRVYVADIHASIVRRRAREREYYKTLYFVSGNFVSGNCRSIVTAVQIFMKPAYIFEKRCTNMLAAGRLFPEVRK